LLDNIRAAAIAAPAVLAADWGTGVVRAEAGLSLDALLRACVPRGWFLPVSPGSRTRELFDRTEFLIATQDVPPTGLAAGACPGVNYANVFVDAIAHKCKGAHSNGLADMGIL
jgi:FAD/FMN-containing dehydrogenase